MTRVTTRLCSEPGCREVLVDALAGARCPAHRSTPWARWRASQPAAKVANYGPCWRRFRNAIIAERGARWEYCGRKDKPLELPHVDHPGPGSPRFFDPANVKLACVRCHRHAP